MKDYSIAETFNIPVPKHLTVKGWDAPSPATPPVDPNYVFRTEILRDVLAWLTIGGKEGLFLTGPTGCGKSSVIVQVAARLNIPTYRVTAHARMEFPELVGQFVLVKGDTVFSYGPLAKAMKHGGIFLLDEIDMLDPAAAVGLNGIVEGAPLTIPENGGEIVYPHPEFRFVATGNTKGSGDISGNYSGTLKQNLAFLDRFWVVAVNYPPEEVEMDILRRTRLVPEDTIPKFVRCASEIRNMFLGTRNDDPWDETRISITLSTRGLVRWATLTSFFAGLANAGEKPLYYALDRTILFRAQPHEREAIKEIVQRVFDIDHT